MAPVKAQNYITLMEGTKNQKSFYLENPRQPTENDILKIKKAYGIKPDTTLQQTRELLNEIEAGKIDTPMSMNPNIAEGSPEFYAEAFGKTADVMERMELIEDPMQYYGNSILPMPGIVSEPTFSAIGGITAATAAQSAKIAATRNPFAILTPAEMAIAEAAGSDMGTKAYRLGNNIIRSLMDLPEEDLKTQASQALYDTALNTFFTMGGMSIAPIFNAFKSTIGSKMFGVSPDKKNLEKIAQISATYGMPMGIIQASNMPFWKGYSKVIGVFPWVGAAFGKQSQAVDEGARQYLGKMANGLAPMQTITQLGGDISKIMNKNYEATRNAQQYLYENFEEFAKKLKGKKVVNLSGFKEVAKDTAAQFQEAIPGMSGYGEFRFPGDGTKRAFGEFYKNMSGLEENVTLEQAITLRQMFNDFLTNFKSEFKGTIPREEAQAIGNLAARLEFDLLNLKNVDNAIDETVFNTALAKLAAANEYFAMTTPQFQGGIASNIKQVNSNAFGPGPDVDRGLMYKDEIFEIIFGRAKSSPEAMDHLLELSQTTPDQIRAYKKAGNVEGKVIDLEVLVKNMDIKSPMYGKFEKKVMPIISAAPDAGRKKILRKLFDDAIEGSIEGLPDGVTSSQYLNMNKIDPTVIQAKGLKKAAPDMLEFSEVRFNPTKFADGLGLNTEKGQQILGKALEGTGVTLNGVKNFIDAVNKAKSFEVSDASTFLQRRLTLTGFRGMMMFGAGTAMSGASLGLGPLLTAAALKYGSRIMTNPKYLKAFTDVFERIEKFPGDTNKILTTSLRNDLLDFASNVLPTEEELTEQEFLQNLDESIFSLMEKQQTKTEAKNARDQQMSMMTGNRTGPQKRVFGTMVDRLSKPSIPVSGDGEKPLFQPATSSMNPRVRNELAFGSIDDAISAQGGIGGL
tara:strand:- start:342 stop:3068 length:2727 start_codon:yes stop_codon:yes gene_type:complete